MGTPRSRDSGRDLLFGLLAFQNNFIDRSELLGAFDAWTTDKSRSLGEVLSEQGAISREVLSAIDLLVTAHLVCHGGSAERSLAALPHIGAVRGDLESLADGETRRTLASLAPARSADVDAFATQASFVGDSTSAGMRFRFLRPLSKGGMGMVSVALDTELDRAVALKEIIDDDADSPEHRARFLAEAEITGKLEHPGIIPIYGLGAHADGRPYYAMRLISGEKTGSLMQAIREFHGRADSADRVVEFRGLLNRFVNVCNAVSYAHSKGVLHRDLKPENIVLGAYGETLLLDWGLAKPEGEETEGARTDNQEQIKLKLSGSEFNATLAGTTIGTPGYAPPEQLIGDISGIGKRSDVYGLGAVLYCLITGQPPLSARDSDLGEIVRCSREGKITPPRQIRPAIDKALEAICVKAMRPRSCDRYESVGQLAADVENYLAEERVSAYPEPLGIRLRRWTKKHRTAVASAAATLVAAVVALAAGLVIVGGLNHRLTKTQEELRVSLLKERVARKAAEESQSAAEKAGKREQVAAEAARRETVKVVSVIDFLVNTFRTTDPIGIAGLGFRNGNESAKSVTALEILDRSAHSVGVGLKGQPEVRATLEDTIGDVYRSLGEMGKAKDLITKAFEIRRSLDPESADTATSLFHLALFHMDESRFDEAEKRFREALAIREARFGDPSPESLEVRFYLAALSLFQCETSAGAEFKSNLDAWLKLKGDHAREIGIARMGYAAALLQSEDYLPALIQGELAFRTLLDKKQVGLIMQSVRNYQLALGIHRLPGQLKRAEGLLRESRDLARQAFGFDHPYVIFSQFALGDMLEKQGRLADAEECYRLGIDLCRKTVGLRHPKAISAVMVVANLMGKTGRYDEGRALYEELVKERRTAFGPNHILVGQSLLTEADYAFAHGDLATRDARVKEAKEVYRSLPRDRRRDTLARNLSLLGDILVSANQTADAEPILREALAITKLETGEKSLDSARVALALGNCLLRTQSSASEAEELLAFSGSIHGAISPPSASHARVLSALSLLRISQGRYDEAVDSMRKSADIASKVFSESPLVLAVYAAGAAEPLLWKGEYGVAIETIRAAQRILMKVKSIPAPTECQLECVLALALLRSGDVGGHRTKVRELLRKFGDTQNAREAARLAWLCVRTPGAVDDPDSLVARADGLMKLGPHDMNKPIRTLARIRAGRFEEALKLISDSRAQRPVFNAWEETVLALALKKVGRVEDSKAALERAETWRRKPAAKLINWEEFTELELLKREAVAD